MAVEFVDEVPPSNSKRGEFSTWLDEVKAQPGKWAKRHYVGKTSASSVGTTCRQRGFEATTRGADLYVRWPKK